MKSKGKSQPPGLRQMSPDGVSSSATDPTEAWRAIAGRDFSGSQDDARPGAPDDSSFSPPSGLGTPGLGIPGRGTGSR